MEYLINREIYWAGDDLDVVALEGEVRSDLPTEVAETALADGAISVNKPTLVSPRAVSTLSTLPALTAKAGR